VEWKLLSSLKCSLNGNRFNLKLIRNITKLFDLVFVDWFGWMHVPSKSSLLDGLRLECWLSQVAFEGLWLPRSTHFRFVCFLMAHDLIVCRINCLLIYLRFYLSALY
jgi:hypothetical protein